MNNVGLTNREQQLLCGLLSTVPNVEKAVVYGSRAKGCNHRFSDVDLTLMGENLTFQDLRKLENGIDDLLLPYEFDLSLYAHLTNEALVDHINRVGKTIYERL